MYIVAIVLEAAFFGYFCEAKISLFCDKKLFKIIFEYLFCSNSLVKFGANVDKIHKKTCLVPLEAELFEP